MMEHALSSRFPSLHLDRARELTEKLMDDQRINVHRLAQVPQAATVARRFAEANGFPAKAQWEIATIAAELASNMVKHAGSGVLTLSFSPADGLSVMAQDNGTFIGDPKEAMQDGYSRGGMREPHTVRPNAELPESHGTGLGAVWRLSDRLDIALLPEGGTRVTALKFLPDRAGKS
jgi:anti-sigma regulatory factor (Ser/Thr protein kinase)